jgi:Flp pilus assembly protein TadG
MKKKTMISMLKNDRGVAAVIVGIFILFVGIGIAGFVVDIGYLNVVKNEIQNAGDAGSLAGANDLFLPDGSINTGANQTAYNVASSNRSGGNPVEVNWTSPENNTDVQRGHWTFGNPGFFTENPNTTQVSLFIPNHDYNADTNLINAVKVVTHNTQIPSFFAKIFGFGNYHRTSDAVATRCGANEFKPGDFDYPVAICIESITDDDGMTCNIGRMINSGGNEDTHNTGGWTNFTQPCVTASAGGPGSVPTGCGEGNSGLADNLVAGGGMGATGGQLQSVLTAIRNCFFDPTTTNERPDGSGGTEIVDRDTDDDGTIVDTPLVATLPVIECPGNNISNCAILRTAVKVQIVWISEEGTGQLTAPTKMYRSGFPSGPGDDHWTDDPNLTVEENWTSFATYFGLLNSTGDPAPLQKKAIYFKPECGEGHIAGTGASDDFFGIFSETSVLVE